MAKHNLTTADLDLMERNDEWAGFGYLGERRNARLNGKSIVDADAKVLEAANAQGLTADALFEWANSKTGRWYGDCMFGGFPQQGGQYLPVRAA